ncbi:SGNH/GDSL hydrolase family protein [Mangrovactinospora gilvigrisea]|nr:SGNH/GDSL hydrolase family protein [Mangrovactinospora gilvigrisea]
MSRARVARRIAAAAAVGGGGIGVLGGAAIGLLLAEARLAMRAIGITEGRAPNADGLYGAGFAERERSAALEAVPPGAAGTLTLAVLGDSTAAGLGVAEPGRTPGALLAGGLAALAERPVRLVNVALSGARSTDLPRQTPLALAERPDAAVVIIGANDITHRVKPAESVRLLTDAVRALREAGAEVVVCTCPDLGTVRPVKQPLRYLARRASRQLAAAQTIAVVENGGRTVSLGDLLGPEFAARPSEMFGPDRFHPSAEGYLTAAMAVLPTLGACLSLWPEEEAAVEVLEPARGEALLPVAEAAAEAVETAGTEVAGTPRSHWAQLKRRRLRQLFTARGAPASLAEAE